MKSEAHRKFIRGLPCVVCLNDVETECAHIRMTDLQVDKTNPGMGRKPKDCWTIPLCSHHHQMQHRFGERNFWEKAGIDPISIAMALYSISGDYEAGEAIVKHGTVLKTA